MGCRKFREFVMTTRGADRTQADVERLAGHALHCQACASFATKAEALEQLLQTSPAPAAPPDFTSRVMNQVRTSAEPARVGWYEALFGSLRAPAPAIGLRQAVASVALVLMVASLGLWVGHHRGALPGGPASTISVAGAADGQVIQVDRAFVEEVIARHQSAAAMQPLSDDDSMRLVSY